MENEKYKQTEEALAEIYRNAQLALQSISNILPQVDDSETRAQLEEQHEEYERFSAKAAILAKNKGIELKEPNPFKKAMMWGSIKMNTMTDNSRSHIAEMMIKGATMGITEATKLLRESENSSCSEEALSLARRLIKYEEESIDRLKKFL
mgnify:CR=1 FL=1